jgi:DNA polymerase beta
MNKKDLIILKLKNLKKKYSLIEDKKWNLRALSIAINSIEKYNGEIIDGTYMQNNLKGIGEKIAKRIDEILETGDLKELNDDNENSDKDYLENLLLITGVGNVRAKKWLSLGIKNIDDVKNAIIQKKITSTHHIDIGIKYYYDFQKKIPRKEIDEIKNCLKLSLQKINKDLIFEICGSYRRNALESGDIDVLVSHPNFINNIESQKFLEKIVKELTKSKLIIDNLTSKGSTKFMGVCKIENSEIARRIDIRVINYESFYAALIYFTGSKNFNVYIRNKALEKNFSLNEYALTDMSDNTIKILNSEKEIFEIL